MKISFGFNLMPDGSWHPGTEEDMTPVEDMLHEEFERFLDKGHDCFQALAIVRLLPVPRHAGEAPTEDFWKMLLGCRVGWDAMLHPEDLAHREALWAEFLQWEIDSPIEEQDMELWESELWDAGIWVGGDE